MSVKIDCPALPRVLAQLNKLPSAQRKHIAVAVTEELADILRDSKRIPPKVPVDTGFLQGSGYIEPAKIDGGTIEGAVGYSADYARIVHDNMNGRIKNYKRPGSGPKFLEAHWLAHQPKIVKKLNRAHEDAIEEAFG